VQHLPSVPRFILFALVHEGFDEKVLLDGLDLSAQQLADETFRLDQSIYERFLQRALDVTGDPHLALRVVGRIDAATSNLVIMTMFNAGTISRAIELFSRYAKLYTRTIHFSVQRRDNELLIDLRPVFNSVRVNYFVLTLQALFLDHLFKSKIGGAHIVKRLEIKEGEPSKYGEVKNRFGFPIMFNMPQNCVVIDPLIDKVSLKQADPQTVRLLEEMCEARLPHLENEPKLVDEVKAVVLEMISAPTRLDDVAKRFRMSPRSFRRKLREEGTSYQRILEDTRELVARSVLLESSKPIAEIAYELGFENPSHFARAFKRWTGRSPSSFRSETGGVA